MPRHVGQRTVDEDEKPDHEKQVRREAHSLGKGAGDERGGDDGKLHLEEGIEGQGDGGTTQYLARGGGEGVCSHALKHEEGGGVADDAADVVAKGEAEAEDHPQDTDDSHGDETLQHGGNNVFGSHHTAIEEGETRGHHEHEDGGRDEPCHIGGTDARPVAGERGLAGKETGNGDEGHRRHKDYPFFVYFHLFTLSLVCVY